MNNEFVIANVFLVGTFAANDFVGSMICLGTSIAWMVLSYLRARAR